MKEYKQTEPEIYDVIEALKAFDSLTKDSGESEKLHKRLVSEISKYNLYFGSGSTSISKARGLIQHLRTNNDKFTNF